MVIKRSISEVEGVVDPKAKQLFGEIKGIVEAATARLPANPPIVQLGGSANGAGVINKINELIARLQEDPPVGPAANVAVIGPITSPSGGLGTVTNTLGALGVGQITFGNGGADITSDANLTWTGGNLFNAANSGEFRSTSGTVQTFMQSSSGNGGFIGTRSNDYLSIRTNNFDRLFIDSAGKVGVKTVSPASQFEVDSTDLWGITGIATATGALAANNTTALFNRWTAAYLSFVDSVSNYANGVTKTNAFLIEHTVASGADGGKDVLMAKLNVNAALTNDHNYNAGYFLTVMNVTDSSGGVFAINPQVILAANKTVSNLTAGEFNIDARTGSTVTYKAGIQIVPTSNDVVQGTTYDGAVSIGNQTSGVGWKNGILFSAAHGANPMNANGTLIKTQGNATTTYGIDLSSYTFTSDAINVVGNVRGTTFIGALTGNASGSSGSCTGNAATASALQTARNIGGVSFDGTASILPITLHGKAGTGGTVNNTNDHMLFWNAGGTNYLEIWIDNIRVANLQYNGAGFPAVLVNN